MKQRNPNLHRHERAGDRERPTNSFDVFLSLQRRRIHGQLAVAWRRISDARREAARETHDLWETRGRLAGYCGLRPAIGEDE